MDEKCSQKQNQKHFLLDCSYSIKTQYCVLPKQNTIIINVTPNETYNILPTFLCKWTVPKETDKRFNRVVTKRATGGNVTFEFFHLMFCRIKLMNYVVGNLDQQINKSTNLDLLVSK